MLFRIHSRIKLICSRVVLLSVFSLAISADALTSTEADLAFNALNQVYWDYQTRYFRKEENSTKKADFWLEAQLWDTVMDQYDRTHSKIVKQQIIDVYEGFIREYPDWTANKFNDDIMWWTIGCTRAYMITKDRRFLQKAKTCFDFVYDNFCDDTLGGGIWWSKERKTKNSCIVCPSIIAAVRLSALLKDDSYYNKALKLYKWQYKTLTDRNGKVYDRIELAPGSSEPKLVEYSLTYNQGTYIGASVLMYKLTGRDAFLKEAQKTADWTKDNLCTGEDRILQSENQGDGGAFKGIFARYMKLLIHNCDCTEYLPWMRINAETAWSNRRQEDNIMGYDWSQPTGRDIQSQTAASAVALLLCFTD